MITIFNSKETINVTLTDNNSKGIPNMNIINNLDNIIYTTDSDGRVLIPIKNITPGVYDVLLTFICDDVYSGSSVVMHLIVRKVNTELVVPRGVSKIYNKAQNIKITLRDNEGRLLNDKIISIDNNIYMTDSNGRVKFEISNLASGSHNMEIKFNGDNEYESSSININIQVEKGKPLIFSPTSLEFNSNKKIKKSTVTLKDNNNEIMKNKTVILKIKQKNYKIQTNNNGQATFNLSQELLTKKSEVIATIIYEADECYNPVNKKIKINIK